MKGRKRGGTVEALKGRRVGALLFGRAGRRRSLMSLLSPDDPPVMLTPSRWVWGFWVKGDPDQRMKRKGGPDLRGFVRPLVPLPVEELKRRVSISVFQGPSKHGLGVLVWEPRRGEGRRDPPDLVKALGCPHALTQVGEYHALLWKPWW